MGFSSAFTLYRKYNKSEMTDSEKSDIIKIYTDLNKRKYDCLPDEAKEGVDYADDLPIVMSKLAGRGFFDSKKSTLGEKRGQYFIDYHPADMLIDVSFCSNSRFLADEFNLGHGRRRQDIEVIVSKAEARDMLTAIRYLLAGEYSEKIERILNNRWIGVFGHEYPKKINHDTSKDNVIFIEKTDFDGYRVVFGREESGDEYDNASIETLMTRLATILSAYLDCDDAWDDESELVLVYDISY